tara:strand:- start:233 stop:511 length:279 start_codon:yes stop_codon:yes gene_type:complete
MPIIGLFLLMPLGFIQVVTSLYLVTKRDVVSQKNQKLLSIYFLIIFGFLILMALISISPSYMHILLEMLSPFMALIPVYFIYVCFNFQKEFT